MDFNVRPTMEVSWKWKSTGRVIWGKTFNLSNGMENTVCLIFGCLFALTAYSMPDWLFSGFRWIIELCLGSRGIRSILVKILPVIALIVAVLTFRCSSSVNPVLPVDFDLKWYILSFRFPRKECLVLLIIVVSISLRYLASMFL